MDVLNPKIKALRTEQNISLQNAIANKELNDAVINAERAGVSYERAIQLEESGKYIAEMQERVLQRNRQALGGINADIMTAKRIATVNQQNTIHANNVTDYMQTSIIFLCVAIVVMFIFGMAMNFFKRFIAHPVVIMQVLLIVLATIYIIVILYNQLAARAAQLLADRRVLINIARTIEVNGMWRIINILNHYPDEKVFRDALLLFVTSCADCTFVVYPDANLARVRRYSSCILYFIVELSSLRTKACHRLCEIV